MEGVSGVCLHARCHVMLWSPPSACSVDVHMPFGTTRPALLAETWKLPTKGKRACPCGWLAMRPRLWASG